MARDWTVGELREALRGCADTDVVRLISQPSRRPMEYGVVDVVTVDADEFDEAWMNEKDAPPENGCVVYFVEGRQVGYLPHAAREYL